MQPMAEQSTLSGRIARFAKVGANLGGFAAGAAVARAVHWTIRRTPQS
jgi:hypothetical protein